MNDTTVGPDDRIPTDLVTMPTAGALANVHPRTIRRAIARGDITGYRFGPRVLRVSLADVRQMFSVVPNAKTERAS